MKGGRHGQFGVEQLSQRLPEFGRELGIAVADDRFGYTVSSTHNVFEKQLGGVNSGRVRERRNEVSTFAVLVNDDEDRIVSRTSRTWQLNNEVHGDNLPLPFRYRQRL